MFNSVCNVCMLYDAKDIGVVIISPNGHANKAS